MVDFLPAIHQHQGEISPIIEARLLDKVAIEPGLERLHKIYKRTRIHYE
jgi:hypothetical protein